MDGRVVRFLTGTHGKLVASAAWWGPCGALGGTARCQSPASALGTEFGGGGPAGTLLEGVKAGARSGHPVVAAWQIAKKFRHMEAIQIPHMIEHKVTGHICSALTDHAVEQANVRVAEES